MPYHTVDGIRIARAIANDRQSNANLTVDGINYSKIAKPTSYHDLYILHEFVVGSDCNGLQRPCMAPYELPKRI